MTAAYPIPHGREHEAACAGLDTDRFFPLPVPGGPTEAKAVCRSCVFLHPCLEYALDRPDILGVWGGSTWDERATMRRQMRRAA